ncbi:hypothetical protein U9M48_001434 [Paspalum notatum var. saurae]|uniref:Uncharacterized protein n=1 Tax=Paspalum notatum var. saurae TaxID=547442 RepID=A0AAQ3SIY9_PASNO
MRDSGPTLLRRLGQLASGSYPLLLRLDAQEDGVPRLGAARRSASSARSARLVRLGTKGKGKGSASGSHVSATCWRGPSGQRRAEPARPAGPPPAHDPFGRGGSGWAEVWAQTAEEHVVRYTMHDLVHDLARLTMADGLIVVDATLKRKASAHEYCSYSLLKNYVGTRKMSNILPSKMRVLRFSDCGKLDIPSGAFSFVKCLRTLDFSETSGILLPDSIGQLKQLRCLIAPRMQNESLPEFITELAKLQYLNINESCEISTLPESICKLGFLEYLSLSGCSRMSKLPESFGDLKCMVHLDMSGCTGISALPGSFGKLANLQHLELSNCSSLQEIPESLCGITQLQHLILSSCDSLKRLPEDIGNLADLQYLNMSKCRRIEKLPKSMMKLQNLSHLDFTGAWHVDEALMASGNLTNLKKLSLSGCNVNAVDFIGTLTNLEELDLSWNTHLQCLPESICNLKRLHTLDLSWCRNLESLPSSIGTLGLRSLLLDKCSTELMDQASSLVHYSRTLPVFKVLADDVSGCRKLQLLEGAHHISELRILSLENASCLEEASKAKLMNKHNLSKLTLSWTTGVNRHLNDGDLLEQLVPPRGLEHLFLEGYGCTRFPGWVMDISGHLTNLISIVLRNLPNCSNLPPLGQLPCLEKLSLSHLPNIKKIGWEFCGGKGTFRRLSSFEITVMEGLEEWNTTDSAEDGVEDVMFPVLDSLTIRLCPRLRLKPCPLTFRECEITMSNQVISSFEEAHKISHHTYSTRATKLKLWGMHCQSIEVFHHFSALQVLEISFCDKLMSLPESIRHLTSLQSLTLDACGGISALPEWLGDLSSLKTFKIIGCQSIKSLPSCINQLKELEKLQIRQNRKLKEWCESEENKIKLAHINVINVCSAAAVIGVSSVAAIEVN